MNMLTTIHCPNCGAKLNARAFVDHFLQDPEWLFWGEKGNRWMICKNVQYVHFKIVNKNQIQHRLAVIRV